MFSDTFAGIAPSSAPGYITAQIVGGLIGLALIAVLYPDAAATADDVVVPHHSTPLMNEPVDQRSSS
jgi:glycerol uptake facilitator-like aquaporin